MLERQQATGNCSQKPGPQNNCSSVDTTRSYHQQLQQDEKRGHYEAKPQVSCLFLLRQLLTQQYFAHQFKAEHRQHPEES